jgi:hypothetical protein
MKLALPRGQQWFAVIVIAIFVLYLGNRLWTHRDIALRWREEVQLADGSRMWIGRAKITGMRPGIDRGVKADQIIIPGEKGDVVWEFPLSPMILERGKATGRWVVIATPGYCEEYYQYGSPKPPYIQFDYINGQWSHKHVSPEWYGKRANLLGDFEHSYEQFSKREGKSFTTKQIEQFNGRIFDAAKEQIVVEANYKSNCYESGME